MAKNEDSDARRREISEAVRELHDAMMESLEATEAEDRAKIRKIKAQKRLSLARSTVHAITFNA